LGYLILPSLVPALLWIVGNRRFIEQLTGRTAEPALSRAVETPQARDS